MSQGRFPRIEKVWRESLSKVEDRHPGARSKISARVTPQAGLTGRSYGFFDERTGVVGLSPRLEAEPTHRIEGIVRHELGHACDHFFVRPKAPPGQVETRADELAQDLWDTPITYDEFDVQTSKPTGGPRPLHLHR
jgi:hypothetical protein